MSFLTRSRTLTGVLLTTTVLLFTGCQGQDETEQVSQAYFEQVAQGDLQGAYDATSQDFKDVTPYTDFEAFMTQNQMDLYTGFESSSYGFDTTDGVKTRYVTGDMSFSDGVVAPVRIDWVYEEDLWKLLAFEFTTTPDSSTPDSSTSGQ